MSEGVVASLNQQDGNITGVDLMSGGLTGENVLELLSQFCFRQAGLLAFSPNTKGVESSLRVGKDFKLAAAAHRKRESNFSAGASTDAGN